MKTKFFLFFLFLYCVLAACQTTKPPSLVTTSLGTEFTLAPDQSASIRDTDLMVTFQSVLSDDRCPSRVECAASGPVAVSLSVQEGNDAPSNIDLQTFTDQDGRAPERLFEGIQDQMQVGNYLIRMVGVLPYPQDLSDVKASDYRVTLMVTEN